jgi:hypothetical protein
MRENIMFNSIAAAATTLKRVRHICVAPLVMATLFPCRAASFEWIQGVDDFNHGYYVISIAKSDGAGL